MRSYLVQIKDTNNNYTATDVNFCDKVRHWCSTPNNWKPYFNTEWGIEMSPKCTFIHQKQEKMTHG